MVKVLYVLGLIIFIILTCYLAYYAMTITKRAMANFDESLSKAGFKYTKRIILNDYNVGLSIRSRSSNQVALLHSGLWVDYETKRIAVLDVKSINFWSYAYDAKNPPLVFAFSEIRDYEVLAGTRSVYSGMAVGYGPFTTVIGDVTNFADGLQIKIIVKGVSAANSPIIYLLHSPKVLDYQTSGSKVSQDSRGYQACLDCACDITDELANIMRLTHGEAQAAISAQNSADELAKFKKLLDDGAITQDEFDAKKKQLLGL